MILVALTIILQRQSPFSQASRWACDPRMPTATGRHDPAEWLEIGIVLAHRILGVKSLFIHLTLYGNGRRHSRQSVATTQLISAMSWSSFQKPLAYQSRSVPEPLGDPRGGRPSSFSSGEPSKYGLGPTPTPWQARQPDSEQVNT